MQPEAESPVAIGNLSETQKALVSEIMQTWKSKAPIVMKKVRALAILFKNIVC